LAIVGVGVWLAASHAATFFGSTEPENATVSGNASVINDGGASNGKAISFNAPAAPPSGGGGGGGGSASCPAYPAFPSAGCTGWQHTGVTLTAVNSVYYANTDGEVLDSKDFKAGVVVEANNVTIKRSRVQVAGLNSVGIMIEPQTSGTLVED